MTQSEFNDLGAYATGLWPKFILTPDQKEMWWHKLRFTDIFTAREALGNAYANSQWKEPTLANVLHAVKEMRRATPSYDPDFTPGHIAQVEREEADDAIALEGWTAQDYENGKAEIISHEPGMVLLDDAPANGTLWRHFLVERYIYQRATIFTTGTVTQSGKAIRHPAANPLIVSRDNHWFDGPQPRREGFRRVGNGDSSRRQGQAAKMAVNQMEESK